MKNQTISDNNYSIDFLVSILVKYPQIFSIKYNNALKSYIFTFMHQGELSQGQYLSLKDKLQLSFKVYHELNKNKDIDLIFKKKNYNKCTLINISFNVSSLDPQDINLLASIVILELGGNIVSDYDEISYEYLDSDSLNSEREIEYLITEGNSYRRKDNLIVFREAGKVYVFDK